MPGMLVPLGVNVRHSEEQLLSGAGLWGRTSGIMTAQNLHGLREGSAAPQGCGDLTGRGQLCPKTTTNCLEVGPHTLVTLLAHTKHFLQDTRVPDSLTVGRRVGSLN